MFGPCSSLLAWFGGLADAFGLGWVGVDFSSPLTASAGRGDHAVIRQRQMRVVSGVVLGCGAGPLAGALLAGAGGWETGSRISGCFLLPHAGTVESTNFVICGLRGKPRSLEWRLKTRPAPFKFAGPTHTPPPSAQTPAHAHLYTHINSMACPAAVMPGGQRRSGGSVAIARSPISSPKQRSYAAALLKHRQEDNDDGSPTLFRANITVRVVAASSNLARQLLALYLARPCPACLLRHSYSHALYARMCVCVCVCARACEVRLAGKSVRLARQNVPRPRHVLHQA
jgi:hypothetical protein